MSLAGSSVNTDDETREEGVSWSVDKGAEESGSVAQGENEIRAPTTALPLANGEDEEKVGDRLTWLQGSAKRTLAWREVAYLPGAGRSAKIGDRCIPSLAQLRWEASKVSGQVVYHRMKYTGNGFA